MIKKILVFSVFFFVFATSAYAVSSTFFFNAQRWYNEECRKRPDRVKEEEAVLCYSFDKLSELQVALSFQDQEIDDLENRVDSLEQRIQQLENPPSPIPTPNILTVSSGQSFFVPEGYKSMTIKLKNVSNLPSWAPTVSFDGSNYKEQHRFPGNQTEVTIPILAENYRLNKGGPDDFSADVTFNVETGANVVLLGDNISYDFTSELFNTSGYTKIAVTVGGGDNPQNLIAITLLRSVGGNSFLNQSQVICDGGALCPLQTMTVDGGDYKLRLEGSGVGAVMGAILRP